MSATEDSQRRLVQAACELQYRRTRDGRVFVLLPDDGAHEVGGGALRDYLLWMAPDYPPPQRAFLADLVSAALARARRQAPLAELELRVVDDSS